MSQDAYLDAYVAAIKDVDPMSTSLIFNCGMGVVRSKFRFWLCYPAV
jgi:hypothetical protein